MLLLLMALMVMAVVRGGSHAPDGYSGKVLLVSMDGFRWDYIHKVSGLGNFSRLAETGCGVDHVNNAFATVTFPSHYTMVTGMCLDYQYPRSFFVCLKYAMVWSSESFMGKYRHADRVCSVGYRPDH